MINKYNRMRSAISFPYQWTENHIAEVLGNHVVVCDLSNHLDVVLLLPLRVLGFQHHEEVVPVFVLVRGPFGKGGHLPWSEVDPSLDVACPIVEQEHVGVVFPPEILQSANDGNSVKALTLKLGVVGELPVELAECQRNYGPVVDGLVLFFSWKCCHLGACFNYIIRRNYSPI